MLSLAGHSRIFLRTVPTDMRQSFDGLSGLVRPAFGTDPRDGSWFLFLNKRRELLDRELASHVLPKEKIREALNYLSNHWTELRQYLVDGRLRFDNNLMDQLMKQMAIGRKNWLFVGSIAAGERAANFPTLVSRALCNEGTPTTT